VKKTTTPTTGRRAGQALVEFALVLPVMIVLFVGSLEASLLMFSRSSAEYVAGDAARVASQAGNALNADDLSVQTVRDSSLGHTRLARVNEVDIYRLLQDPLTGAITVDSAHVNQYRLDGSVIGSVNWPPASRDVTSTSADLLGITIDYTFPWQTGLFGAIPSPRLRAIYYLRLEPQVY
jgi:Flp pilus assembly protein TadG